MRKLTKLSLTILTASALTSPSASLAANGGGVIGGGGVNTEELERLIKQVGSYIADYSKQKAYTFADFVYQLDPNIGRAIVGNSFDVKKEFPEDNPSTKTFDNTNELLKTESQGKAKLIGSDVSSAGVLSCLVASQQTFRLSEASGGAVSFLGGGGNADNKQTETVKKILNSCKNFKYFPSSLAYLSKAQVELPKKDENPYDKFNFDNLIKKPTLDEKDIKVAEPLVWYLTSLGTGLTSPAGIIEKKIKKSEDANKQVKKQDRVSNDQIRSNALKIIGNPDFADYQYKLRSYLALRSIAVNNFYHLLNERVKLEGAGTAAGLDEKHADISNYEIEKKLASQRTDDKEWYKEMSKASPQAVQREMLFVLAEIRKSMFTLHEDNERMLSTLSAIELLNSNMYKAEIQTAADDLTNDGGMPQSDAITQQMQGRT